MWSLVVVLNVTRNATDIESADHTQEPAMLMSLLIV